MKRASVLIATTLLTLALASCGAEEQDTELENGPSSEEQASAQEVESNEVDVGGFVIEGPTEEISIPEATVEREDLEDYVQSVQPIIEDSARNVSRFIDPRVELQDQRLTLSVEAGSIEEARVAAEDGLDALRQVEPSEGLEPVHELLVAPYVQAIAAYDNVIQAFESGDVDTLVDAVEENLPEVEQFTAETRAILQELDRAESRG